MTHRERIDAAVRGERPDRVPVALWRHFPEDDRRAEKLAQAHIAFYRAYDPDLLKVTPASGYYGDDWGLRAGYKPNREGTRTYGERPIKKASDWERLKHLDVSQGAHGREVHAIRLVAEAVGREVPVLETVFSPLSVARTLAGEQATVRYLREDPEALHNGLAMIADVTAEFVHAVIAAGADGIFFSTQMATTALMTAEEYEEFGRPYDLRILDAVDGGLVFLHSSATTRCRSSTGTPARPRRRSPRPARACPRVSRAGSARGTPWPRPRLRRWPRRCAARSPTPAAAVTS